MNTELNLEEQGLLKKIVQKELDAARNDLAYCIRCVEEKNNAQEGWKLQVERFQQKVMRLVSITNKL